MLLFLFPDNNMYQTKEQLEELVTQKQVQPLAHELEMLAIKLRELTGVKEIPYFLDEFEFSRNTLVERNLTNLTANPQKQAFIQRTFKRWEQVKQLIKEIDPEFFLSMEEKMAKHLSDQIVKEIDQEIINDIIACTKK